MFLRTYIVRGVMWVLVAGPESAAVRTWNDSHWGSVGWISSPVSGIV